MPSVVATVYLPGPPTHLTGDDTFVYVGHSDGAGGFGITAINVSTNSLDGYMPVAGPMSSMTMSAAELFVTTAPTSGWVAVMQVDVLSGTIRTILEFPGRTLETIVLPRTAEFAQQLLFATVDDVTIKTSDFAVSNFPHRQAIAVETTDDGPVVWAATTEGKIFRGEGAAVYDVGPNLVSLDADRDRALWFSRQTGDPDGGSALAFSIGRVNGTGAPQEVALSDPGPGVFALDDHYVWVLGGGNIDSGVAGSVTQITRSISPVALNSTTVGLAPSYVISIPSGVWVANFGSDSVSRIAV